MSRGMVILLGVGSEDDATYCKGGGHGGPRLNGPRRWGRSMEEDGGQGRRMRTMDKDDGQGRRTRTMDEDDGQGG